MCARAEGSLDVRSCLRAGWRSRLSRPERAHVRASRRELDVRSCLRARWTPRPAGHLVSGSVRANITSSCDFATVWPRLPPPSRSRVYWRREMSARPRRSPPACFSRRRPAQRTAGRSGRRWSARGRSPSTRPRGRRAPRGPPPAPRSLVLNLFDDVSLTAVLDRIDPARDGLTWVGRVAGREHSWVTLAVVDGVMAGSIIMPGAVYEIRHAGGGGYDVGEVDQSRFPPEAEPVPARRFRAAPSPPPGIWNRPATTRRRSTCWCSTRRRPRARPEAPRPSRRGSPGHQRDEHVVREQRRRAAAAAGAQRGSGVHRAQRPRRRPRQPGRTRSRRPSATPPRCFAPSTAPTSSRWSRRPPRPPPAASRGS